MSNNIAEQNTITIVPDELKPREAYQLLLSAIIPRPIAWVSSIGTDGTVNLAPFSFFNAISGVPPIVMFSVSGRRGSAKDTLRNAKETGQFVVNIVEARQAEAMNQTSGEWAYDVNEFELSGLEPAACLDVKAPRIAEAALAMEARVTQIIPIDGSSSTMVLGQVLRYHIRAGLLRSNGLIDAEKLRPIGRLGGTEYTTLDNVFSMIRPSA